MIKAPIPIPFYQISDYDMIKVTKLDGTEFLLNPHQIECIEVRPDTTLLMLSGKNYILRESVDIVLDKIVAYRRQLCPCVVQE